MPRLGVSAVTLNGIRLFAGPVDDPRARRASDVIQVVLSAFFLVILGIIAVPPTTIERALITFLGSFPDFLDGLWQALSDVLILAAIAVVIASAVRRRLSLVRDLILAVVVAFGVALVFGRIVEGHWLPAWDTLRQVEPPPWFPGLRIAAFATVLLTARPHLSRPARRLSVWLVGLAAVSVVILGATTPTGAIAALLLASTAAAIVHLVFGSCEGNPGLPEVAAALAQLGVDAHDLGAADRQQAGLFLVKAQDADGDPLKVKVYGRDAHDTQLLATLWRTVWYREPGSPIWVGRRQQVANEGFVTLLAAQAGVKTETVVTAGVTTRDDALLVLRPIGTIWADLDDRSHDEQVVEKLWEATNRLHDAGITHGQLDEEHVSVIAVDGELDIAFVDFRGAEVASSDDRIRSDNAQLVVTCTQALGPERALATARRALGDEETNALLPFLQLPALTRSQRGAVRRDEIDLDELRNAGAADLGVEPPELQQLQRVTKGTLLQAGLMVIAFFALFRVVSGIDFDELRKSLGEAIWWIVVLGFVVAQTPRVTQSLSTLGASPIPLPLGPVYALQLAASYVNLAIPSSAARIAVNVRFFQRHGLATGSALAVGALDGFSGFVVQAMLLVSLLLFTSASLDIDFNSAASGAAKLLVTIIVVVVIVLLLVLIVPKLRRSAFSRVKSLAGEAIKAFHGLRSPRRLGLLFGGNLATELLFATALGIFVRAFGYSIGLGDLVLINVSVALLAGLLPVPGGIGVTEGGLIYGLTAAGMPETTAFAAVIFYRMASFYVPPIWGFFALRWLEKNKHL
ncbi:MAG TPA: lysylphosphatidylglycerol synthase transmembrane domain-containing protein [Acidimicrobiales bacterium]|nr:lysylphosphatidylglycerol synthase transmembrane domain-containing protein [Acidimicrobiales bacterium]